MLLETLSGDLRKARSVSQTSNGFVAKIPTATEPSGDAGTATGASVFDLREPAGALVQNGAYVLFYGTGSNNNTFSCRLIGWRLLGYDPTTNLWVPVLLAEVAVTLSSTYPGVGSRLVASTELFADTISLTYGNANVSIDVNSPANDAGIASVLVDLKGCRKFELSFTTGGVASDCNALFATF